MSVSQLFGNITQKLIQGQNSPESINESLGLILDFSKVSRVYYFEITTVSEDQVYTNQLFEACAEGVEPQIENPDLRMVPMLPYFRRWLDHFYEGKPINNIVSEMPEEEREALEPQGIISILVLPVFSYNKLIGFIGFDDTETKRTWSEENLVVLRESADIIGKMIEAYGFNKSLQYNLYRTEQLLDSLPLACIEWSDDFTIQSWNRAASQLFGYAEEEILNKPITILIPDYQLPSFYDFVEKIRALSDHGAYGSTEIYTLKGLNKKADGTQFFVRWKNRPVFNSDGTLKMVIAIGEDITEELAKQKYIEESEKQYRSLFENMSDGVVFQDESGRIIRANKAASHLLGLSFDELYGRSSLDPEWRSINENRQTFPGEEHPSMVAIKTGKKVHNVNMGIFNPKVGSYRWLNINATPEFLPGETKPYQVFTIFRDITTAFELNERLQHTQNQFLVYANNLTVGVWFRNYKHELTFVNTALATIFGIDKDDFFKDDSYKYKRYIHPDDADAIAIKYNEHLDRKETVEYEHRLIRNNGEIRWVHVRLIYIDISGEEKRPFSAGFMTDITDQKLRIRTLKESKDTAESLSALRMNIIQSISHEFRTPLTSILGFSEMLQLELESSHLKEYAEIIKTSGDRLSNTLESILNYANLISNKYELNLQTFDIAEVVTSVVQNFQDDAKSKDLFLKGHIPENLLVKTDEDIVRSLLSALIDNAIKFTNQGGVTVEVSEQKGNLSIEVHDTGIGIPEHANVYLFEPFRQGSEGISRLHEGSGLGLAIVKRQIELLGGKMRYSNNEPHGVSFFVDVPLQDPIVVSDDNNLSAHPPKTGKEIRILCVEDNAILRLMMSKTLKEYTVDTVGTPEEALKKAEENDYDVFLLDINLNARLSGIDVCQHIRTMPKYRDTLILALTALSKDELQEHINSEEFNGYIGKPFNSNYLKKLIYSKFGVN